MLHDVVDTKTGMGRHPRTIPGRDRSMRNTKPDAEARYGTVHSREITCSPVVAPVRPGVFAALTGRQRTADHALGCQCCPFKCLTPCGCGAGAVLRLPCLDPLANEQLDSLRAAAAQLDAVALRDDGHRRALG